MSAARPTLTVGWLLSFLLVFSTWTLAAPGDERTRTIAALEQALQTDSNNADLWVHLGFAYRKSGDITKSQQAFEKASSLDNRNPEALYMLGLIYESKRDNGSALRAWKQYLSVATDADKKAVAETHIHQLSQ